MATANMKDIKRRQKSIENTMKITKAMELVAFSKLRKSKQQVKQVEPFFNGFYDVMQRMLQSGQCSSIMFNNANARRRCYVVIAGDKGLAGSYNGNILRFTEGEFNKYQPQDIDVIAIGKKSVNFLKKRQYNLIDQIENISECVDIDIAMNISKKIMEGYYKDKYQEINIIFTDFISVLSQKPTLKRVLPLLSDKDQDQIKKQDIMYDPSPKVVFDMVISQYVASMIYGAIIKSFASEQGARRIAMEAANKNAKQMLQDINLMFNKVRQSNITQEITEISAGAQAL